MTKFFMASIYLNHGRAVKDWRDFTIIETNPVRLAMQYEDSGVDGIVIFDLTQDDTDEEHDSTLDIIKEICGKIRMPIMAAGHIQRPEDVKKLLYAGCSHVALDWSKESNRRMAREVSLRFGKERIWALCGEPEIVRDYQAPLEEHVAGLVLDNPHMIRQITAVTSLPFYVHIHQLALNKLMEILEAHRLVGITGNVINENCSELPALKDLCVESGLEVVTKERIPGWEDFKANRDGLVPVVVQDNKTQEVLMVAYMNQEAYEATLETGQMTYYSRSRRALWIKGETSGHVQYVVSLHGDCDMDTILARVNQVGPACHTGSHSCFFNEILDRQKGHPTPSLRILEDVYNLIRDRQANPKEGSYTNYLFDKGLDKILKKMGEEATEIVIAAKNPNPNEIKYEISDFLYHMMVLMAEKDIGWEDITRELADR